MRQLLGIHPTTDMPVYRQFIKFVADDAEQKVITVEYDEWQELPNGSIMPKSLTRKKYHVKDSPAITNEEGQEIEPAKLKYTGWTNHTPDGTKTIREIFVTAINQTLQSLPVGFPDGGII
jgi:hypothetical protein